MLLDQALRSTFVLQRSPAIGRIKRKFMTSIQRLALLGLVAFATVAVAQQTPPNPPPPQPGSQTTTTTTTTQDPNAPRRDQDPMVVTPIRDQTSDVPVPLSKREMKEQRRRQKQQEKAARAQAEAEKHSANADKENAKAMKQQNKSADATEKANTPQ
jgi:outer membrane biosynthesis protein TonB